MLNKLNAAWNAIDSRRIRRPWRLAAVLFLLAGTVLAAWSRFGSAAEETYLNVQSASIPPDYFGMHIHMHDTPMAGAWPAIPFGTWRLSDTGVSWPDLEPQKGVWRFELLDRYVEFVRKQGVEVLLPLVLTPRWASSRPDEPSNYHQPGWAAVPKDMADWRRYVSTVARRYQGKIRFYEIWNEPNTAGLYSGSVEQLIELTRAAREELKAADTEALLVSPSFVYKDGVKKLDEFLAKGGGRYVDVIGFHFYVAPDKPEDMLELIADVRRTMEKHGVAAKPLWNTETGWLIANRRGKIDPKGVGFPPQTRILDSNEASAYVARALILSWAAGVKRVYWYAWDNKAMGLSEDSGKFLKPAAHAYGQTRQWLHDGKLDFCRNNRRAIWTCQLTDSSGKRAWLVWSVEGETRWQPPAEWRSAELEYLDGRLTKIHGMEKGLLVSSSPVLIRPAMLQQASFP